MDDKFQRLFEACLRDNPALLEDLILQNVPTKTLQVWLNKSFVYRTECSSKPSPASLLDARYSSTNIQELERYLINEAQLELQVCRYFYTAHVLLHDALKLLRIATLADTATLYVNDNGADQDVQIDKSIGKDGSCTNVKQQVNSVVKLVAKNGVSLFLPDVSKDSRFRQPASLLEEEKRSLICIPIIFPNGSKSGVIELSRNSQSLPFTNEEFQVANSVIALMSVALHQTRNVKHLSAQKDLDNFLLLVTKKMFNEVQNFDDLLLSIVTYTKTLVAAECCSVFLLDGKGNLYPEVFDEREVDERGNSVYSRKRKDMKFPARTGIIGHAIEMRESVNVKNARSDERFCPDFDNVTNYITKSVLAVPIFQKNEVVGAVEAINKTFGECFTEKDEETLKKFAVHFSLAVNFWKVCETARRRESEASVVKEQLLYHSCLATVSNGNELPSMPSTQEIPPHFEYFEFSTAHHLKILPQLFMHMVRKRFGDKFGVDSLGRFILAVRKNYRDVPYHNWEHGFQVTHCMYCLMQSIQNVHLSQFEAMGLLFACISHDVDHRGYNNTFFQKMEQPLAALYSSSVMEQHHYQTTLLILQANNVFCFLGKAEYESMLEEIREAIIATDMALYFSNCGKLRTLLDECSFDMANEQHRRMAKNLLMTGCDLVGSCKDWPDQVTTVKKLYDEFYIQGDIEKEKGFDPLPFMDRSQKDNLARQQLQFLNHICHPLYSTIADIFPSSKPLVNAVNGNIKKWQQIVNGEIVPPWNNEILDDIGKDRKWASPVAGTSKR